MARKKKPSGRPKNGRSTSQGPTKRKYLIVCEGETERNYFKNFNRPWHRLTVVNFPRSPYALVQTAIAKAANSGFFQVWVVFDLDYTPSKGDRQFEEFTDTLRLAEKHGIYVAYSIDAFELWFRLHYELVTTPIHRQQLYTDLNKRWEIDYEKDGKTADIYTRLDGDPEASLPAAIERAQLIMEQHPDFTVKDRPSLTTVHHLVQNLLTEDHQ